MTQPTRHPDADQGSLRTCVGSRQTHPPEELERFVLLGGQLVFDMRQRAPGRGVWLRPHPECVREALRRGGFQRGFRTKLQVPSEQELLETLRQGITRRLRETLQVAARARRLSAGQEQVSEAMRVNRARLLLIASDASEGSQSKFSQNAARKEIPVCADFDGGELGQLAGREFVSVVTIHDADLATRILRDAQKLRDLGAFEG